MPAGATTLTIAPLPDTAADLPPAVAAVEVTPPPGTYPHAAIAGRPFKIGVRAFAPEETAPLHGVLRWRKVLAARWSEEPLQKFGDSEFSVEWTPAEVGDYEWCVELWSGEDDSNRHGSSGADVLHMLRASNGELEGARWKRTARSPLSDLHPELNGDTDVLLLAPIFPQDADGLTGRDGAGHYTIDPELGNVHDFGELAAAARRAGTMLALTVPLECSQQHPLRQKHWLAFAGGATPDFTAKGWREIWSAWEAVFRFWLVQGIDIFYIPRPGAAPVSFWSALIEHLRDDFPATEFIADPEELAAFGEHLLGVGFRPLATPDIASESNASGVASEPDPQPLITLEPIEPIELIDLQAPTPLLIDEPDGPEPVEVPEAEESIACSCSNTALVPTLYRRGEGFVLMIENRDPATSQSGHVHFDSALLDLNEHERYYLRDLADGRAYRWSGTTNFLSVGAGETAKSFRLERN